MEVATDGAAAPPSRLPTKVRSQPLMCGPPPAGRSCREMPRRDFRASGQWEVSEAVGRKNSLMRRVPSFWQIPCRYGLGCTHMADPVHHQRFWHPTLPEQRVSANLEEGFVCNECGLVFSDLHELQVRGVMSRSREFLRGNAVL